MSKIVSGLFYFTSFIPLWISVLFIDVKSCIENTEHLWTEKISIGIILSALLVSTISLGVLVYNMRKKPKEGSVRAMIKDATEEKTITSEYLLSYMLPLFVFDFTKWDQVILFLIFFVILGFLCIRHNHFSVNILLEILNYKMFICNIENEDEIIISKKIISHRTLSAHKGEYIYFKSINNEIKVDLEK